MRNLKIQLRNKFKASLSEKQIAFLLRVYIALKKCVWPIINRVRIFQLKRSSDLMVNLGCSEKLLPNFVNVDVRVTSAVDITMDLNNPKFAYNSVKCFFSNAFFEHLYRSYQIGHLATIYKSLQNDGFVCYTSIPFFKNIARYYLEKNIGTNGPVFDLFTVYRYTHGDPDRMLKDGWYLGQLHKAIFDEDILAVALDKAGFTSYVIFEHAFPFDLNKLPVNIGFYATKLSKSTEMLQNDTRIFLKQFENAYICMDSIKFLKIAPEHI